MNNGELHRLIILSEHLKCFVKEEVHKRLSELYKTDRLDIELMKEKLYSIITAYDHFDFTIEIENKFKQELENIEAKANKYRNPNEIDEEDAEECDE